MKPLQIVVAAALALASAAPVKAKTVTIGLDLSASSPILTSPEYAQGVARHAHTRVAALQPGDVVVVGTFGDGSLANVASARIRITRRERPDKAALKVASFIASIPAKSDLAQGATRVAAWFEFGSFDCANGGEVIALTDGIESSDDITAKAFLSGKRLPAPEQDILKGCTVTMIGVGQVTGEPLTAKQIKHVRDSWRAWMTQAGVVTFKTIFGP